MTAKEVIQMSQGVKGYPTILSKAAGDRMCKNGWHNKSIKKEDNIEEVIQTLLDQGYKVKYYYSTTYVRGFYDKVVLYKKRGLL